jgi:hypothetical protein
LAVLENFNIKRIRNTPLGERLFAIFDIVNDLLIDQGKRNAIGQAEFCQGLN